MYFVLILDPPRSSGISFANVLISSANHESKLNTFENKVTNPPSSKLSGILILLKCNPRLSRAAFTHAGEVVFIQQKCSPLLHSSYDVVWHVADSELITLSDELDAVELLVSKLLVENIVTVWDAGVV